MKFKITTNGTHSFNGTNFERQGIVINEKPKVANPCIAPAISMIYASIMICI